MHDIILRLEIAAKACCEIANAPVALDQLLTTPTNHPLGADVMAGRCLGHEGVGRLQDGSTFLFQLFPASLDHLIVGRFLNAIRHKLFTEIFFILNPGGAVPGG